MAFNYGFQPVSFDLNPTTGNDQPNARF